MRVVHGVDISSIYVIKNIMASAARGAGNAHSCGAKKITVGFARCP